MSAKTDRILRTDPIDVEARLRGMGLSMAALAAAVRMGQDARSSCTPNDPPAATGIHGWGRTVRGLRENTKPLGWTLFSDDNIHGVINTTGTIAIAVATGDAATGLALGTPKTAYPKGSSMRAAVKRNAEQLSLFSLLGLNERIVPIRKPVVPDPTCLLWLLVVHEGDDEVLFELSLPDDVGEDQRVDTWVERIVLAPIPTDPETRAEPEAEPDLDIPLTRKA